jgi:protein phosphatase
VGAVRDRNEDAAYVDREGRFVLLADGMGGHGAGDVAAQMAVDVVRDHLAGADRRLAALAHVPARRRHSAIQGLLDEAVWRANDAVVARSLVEPDKHGMGTTLEIVLVLGHEVFIAHVGDSRVYLLRDGAVSLLTADHTIAEAMRRAGSLSDEEAQVSPLRSSLSNAIGVTGDVTIDHAELTLEAGDRLLVCSDGLYEYFADGELASHLAGDDPDAVLDALIGEAYNRGGHDNITGVLIDAEPAPADGPLDDVNDEALAGLVEQILRESSVPNRA